MKTIYRSQEGKRKVLEIYDRTLENLELDYESQMIETRYGDTHVLVLGPKNAQPLIALHGGNSYTPYLLKDSLPYQTEFRMYAVDLIGHPGKSAETRLSSKDYSYGEWLFDVINGLEFDSVRILCGSFSAGIVLRLAAIAPEKIQKVAMIVPSGIADGTSRDMIFKLVIPWLNYRLRPSRARLQHVIRHLISEYDEDLLDFLDAVFRHVKIAIGMPRLVKDKREISNFKAPTYIICAKNDILFPPHKVIPRAKEIIPNLVGFETVDGLHGSTSEVRDYTNKIFIDFLKSTY